MITMFLFISDARDKHYFSDYLESVKYYLQDEFGIVANIWYYTATDTLQKHTYSSLSQQQQPSPSSTLPQSIAALAAEHVTRYIFVQKIDPRILAACTCGGNGNGSGNNIYLLNTEQMTVKRYAERVYGDIEKYHPRIIDYSGENIKIFAEKSIQCYYFPFPLIMKEKIAKKHNFTSLTTSEHRIVSIRETGQQVQCFNNMWGLQRDKLIGESRILINIHYDAEYRIFETMRCYHAMSHWTLVVTEECASHNDILLKDSIIFAAQDQLKDTCARVLDNYQEYYDEIFSSENIKRMKQLIKKTYIKNLDRLQNGG